MVDRLQHRHEALTGWSGRSMSRRQGRFHHGGSDSDDGPSSSTAAVVDHADCTAQTCRSCVAVSLADCIALGCCPCALVSLLGLALVKAPLAMGRRCVRRLLRRQGRLRHKKRVGDDIMDMQAAGAKCAAGHAAATAVGEATSKAEDDVAASEAERVWLEMYQVGHWGFGRLSFSVNPPPKAARNADDDGCESDV